MKFEEVNGMSLARYIASILLSDTSYTGKKYYEKEDELVNKIEPILESATLKPGYRRSIFYDEFKVYHREDVENRLEEREIEATEEEKNEITEYYEDWLAESNHEEILIDQAIEKVLEH